tara:strand:+ start:384 stop:617 length:234 start_codon:yes stop_codon:yes gene_type:complete
MEGHQTLTHGHDFISITDPDDIQRFARLAVRSALRLEVMGLRGRGLAFKRAKEIVSSFGETPGTTKKAVLAQLEELL